MQQHKQHSASNGDIPDDISTMLDRITADALSISERFSAEPVFNKTGKGFLRPAGTIDDESLKKILIELEETNS